MIKVQFCDMYIDFDKENNFFMDILRKNFDEVVVSDKPDFLIYGPFGIQHYLYDHCVKIFYTGEAVAPDFNQCDYAIGFDPIVLGKRYLRRPLWLEEPMPDAIQMSDEDALNRRFCNFIYSNDKNGRGSKLRVEFAKKLMKYKRVDCPGQILNNMPSDAGDRLNNWRENKIKFISKYKFTIAFENSSYAGYTTEKMTQPLLAHSVPIYWGNPEVYKDFNSSAFVCGNGLDCDLDRLVSMVIELDQDDQKYLSMLHATPMSETFDYHEKEHFEGFLVDIIKKGNVPIEKDPLLFAKRMSINNLSRREKIEYFFFKKK